MKPPSPTRPAKDQPALKAFVYYLRDYFKATSLKSLLFTTLFAGILIALNYTVGIEKRIRALRPLSLSLLGFFLFYGFVFFTAWGIQYSFDRRRRGRSPNDLTEGQKPTTLSPGGPKGSDRRHFLLLLLLSPLYFACKMIHWDLSFLIPGVWHSPWNRYTLSILQLPAKLVLLLVFLAFCQRIGGWEGDRGNGSGKGVRGYEAEKSTRWKSLGLTTKKFSPLPYLLLLLFLVPLVALASTQQDFLHAYPKFRSIGFISGYAHPIWPWRLLYELSYGLDFVSIELFFRGFLVIGLSRWAGSKAILPMAAFYCTIHFGKPLGECISSFAGGLTLGVIAWRTRSILGGLMVHLGLAWMMEVGGALGNL